MTVFHHISYDGSSDEAASRVDAEISQEFLNRIPGGIFRYRADGDERVDYFNQDLLGMYGCADFEEWKELTGNTFPGMVHPEDLERVEAEISVQAESVQRTRLLYRIVRRDGEVRWVEDVGSLVVDSEGQPWFYVTIIDITDEIHYRQALEEEYERLKIIAALSNDVIFDMSSTKDAIEVFGDFKGRFGRDPQVSDFVFMRRHGDHSNIDPTRIESQLLPADFDLSDSQDFEVALPGADGQPIWCRYQALVQTDDEGNDVRRIGRLLDTHEMVILQAELKRKAEHDSLTNVLNRSAAKERISEYLDGSDAPATFILIDVDNFKRVNDVFGHPEGDRILKELAEHLRRACRSEDIVARLGGDEFVVFAQGLGPGAALDNLVARLVDQNFTPLTTQLEDGTTETMVPTISIGVASTLQSDVGVSDLYQAADNVLYESKAMGKNCAHFCIVEPRA